MPTMAGAFAYDLYKNWSHMGAGSNAVIVAIGFITSFVAGWFVVKTFLDYVSHHGFGLFASWRLIVGAAGLVALALIG
jgi:undecaprenyl-diphosphatase